MTPPVFELTEPILLVVNDADDDLWQLIGSSDPGTEDAKLGHLYHAVDEDPTLVDVLDLEPGEEAERDRVGGPVDAPDVMNDLFDLAARQLAADARSAPGRMRAPLVRRRARGALPHDRRAARAGQRTVPRPVFDYADGAAWDEVTARAQPRRVRERHAAPARVRGRLARSRCRRPCSGARSRCR